MRLEPSSHVDSFCRDNLPPPEQMPAIDLAGVAEVAAYPKRMNCAAELLDKRAAAHPERLAFSSERESLTYGELRARADRIAHVLRDDLGIRPGNRVLLRSANNPAYVACWYAVQKVGGVVVATMPMLRARELATIADLARIEVALCDLRLRAEMDLTLGRAATLKRIMYFGGGDLDAAAAKKPERFETHDTSADDVCLIAFTSGTTGPPKGAMHFHRDILAMCDTVSRYVVRPRPDDVFVGSPPIAFTFGLGVQVSFPMHAGAASHLIETPSPEALLGAIQARQASILATAPTMYRAMLPLLGKYDLRSLRTCVSAGEHLPLATFKAWREATGIRIVDGLGSTEMLHIFVSAAGDDIRPGATGRAIPGYRARVVDEHGNEVPLGTIGRLAVQGPTGCKYLANPEKQRQYVRDGWNYPGDAYLQDKDGYLFYQARTDDLIVSAGYNISGPEVETAMLEHPKVLECAVIGAPDAERGQIVKAFVVLKASAEAGEAMAKALQDHVKATIAPYKYPRAVAFVDSLPKTATGKLQRFVLREKEWAGAKKA
ncbi:MAG: benzoate-CoA ligase family protein [Alphaproteobacteria bacterium]|nr:benzoate-CoA ligase family protein [Alphaproteobacteria bacterium]